jgi:hypothetical protein
MLELPDTKDFIHFGVISHKGVDSKGLCHELELNYLAKTNISRSYSTGFYDSLMNHCICHFPTVKLITYWRNYIYWIF